MRAKLENKYITIYLRGHNNYFRWAFYNPSAKFKMNLMRFIVGLIYVLKLLYDLVGIKRVSNK